MVHQSKAVPVELRAQGGCRSINRGARHKVKRSIAKDAGMKNDTATAEAMELESMHLQCRRFQCLRDRRSDLPPEPDKLSQALAFSEVEAMAAVVAGCT